MIKDNVRGNGTNQHDVLLMGYNERSLISVLSLPKMHNLNLIMRKHPTNSNWEIVYKTAFLPLKKCQDHERQRKTDETSSLTTICTPGLDKGKGEKYS